MHFINQDVAEFNANRMQVRYVLALTLIALLTIVSQWVVQRSLANQEYDSRVVNIAGRQRMLSQKITKTALYLKTSEDGDKNHACKTACKTFQISGVISVQKLPPWVV